ncbi:MAG: hypothetical protein KJI69_06575, partial [Patescibacteria group bacterium]|nr:hypothetical protein [Patescibacteria group bacterium]
ILSRDLRNVSEENIKYIRIKDSNLRYLRDHEYNDEDSLNKIDVLFNEIKKTRDFISKSFDIEANIKFPSTYHFYLYQF